MSRHLPKVKLFRTMKREGLIRARIFGAEQAKGEVTHKGPVSPPERCWSGMKRGPNFDTA